MNIILDNIAIWRPTSIDELSMRIVPKGKKYQNADSPVMVVSAKPMYRYAKNYTVGKKEVKFCLFVRTFNDNAKDVEAQLDEVAKTITVAKATEVNNQADYMSFEYLTERIK